MKGEGVKGSFPPLAKSDYLMVDLDRSISQILIGNTDKITVNGVKYYMPMMGIDLTDIQVADVLNYIRNSWGNKGEIVLPKQVRKVRKSITKK
jgi:nitrite reductase (NO-forming)